MRVLVAVSYGLLAAISVLTFHGVSETMPILLVLAVAALVGMFQALLSDKITYRSSLVLTVFWLAVVLVSILFVLYYIAFDLQRPYFVPLATMFIALIGSSESARSLSTYRELTKRVNNEKA